MLIAQVKSLTRFSNVSIWASLLGVCLGEGPQSGNQIKVEKVTVRRDPWPRGGGGYLIYKSQTFDLSSFNERQFVPQTWSKLYSWQLYTCRLISFNYLREDALIEPWVPACTTAHSPRPFLPLKHPPTCSFLDLTICV